MATPIPSPSVLRALRTTVSLHTRRITHTSHASQSQIRHATLLKRPKRPYTFTQLITLSDGSSFLHRTTSPLPTYKSQKDVRNNPLWNPSSQKLLNVEEDEAGKLKAFRDKFGRGWDAEQGKGTAKADHFMDLISGQGAEAAKNAQTTAKAADTKAAPAKPAAKTGKK
ncbi:hypothetical protein CC80DRAFT_492144 [Byssothecium circinans]|uniref:Ribosomal protein bL31m N-terminal domain-containing protein n=1 Tax=Byssothecium circinans TaxID=147558 RepID=A0A6A5TX33_9PLEO|nr:hypothetical protein CC80DRAFT_492144 [Byssothecium circinans]